MGMLTKIAWRNIMRHKGKSLIIGTILFIGAYLMTLGNGVISGMERGLAENIIHGFCGDIVIVSKDQESDNVFLEMMGKSVEPINNYPQIEKVLKQQSFVQDNLPVGKNMVMILNEEGTPGYAYVLGVEWNSYSRFFKNNLVKLEGDWPVSNEWILFPTAARKDNYDLSGVWFVPVGKGITDSTLTEEAKEGKSSLILKDNVVFMGFNESNSTSDVRVPICGVTKYRSFDKIFGQFALMDIENYRKALGYFSADEKVELDADQKELFESDNLDAMFSSDASIVENVASQTTGSETVAAGEPSKPSITAGTYNLIYVSLKEGENLAKRTAELNKLLEQSNCHAKAIPWNKAIGPLGSMAILIKLTLFGFVSFLFFVAIIIIVNTLSMAALERTSEIGMMRAVGAKKGFIAGMFASETAVLSFFFGGIGIAAGMITVVILPFCNITAPNEIVQILFGGEQFRPRLTPVDLILVIIQLVMVTGIAVLYPLKVALGITPLDAISRD